MTCRRHHTELVKRMAPLELILKVQANQMDLAAHYRRHTDEALQRVERKECGYAQTCWHTITVFGPFAAHNCLQLCLWHEGTKQSSHKFF